MTGIRITKRTNINGFQYVIKEYDKGTKRCIVFFPHNGVSKDVSYSSVVTNTVSEKLLFGTPSKPLEERIYALYHAMKFRLKTLRAYENVKLDPRWETFEGFRSTIHLVEGFAQWSKSTGYVLDKDMKGKRMYGPDTCVFMTRAENTSLPTESYNVGRQSRQERFAVGTTHECKDGRYEIIEKINSQSRKIRFLKTGFVTVARVSNLLQGSTKDRLHPSVSGIGYLGEEDFSKHPEYKTLRQRWTAFLRYHVKNGKFVPEEDKCFAEYFRRHAIDQ